MREAINPPVKDRQSEFDQVHRFLEAQSPLLLTTVWRQSSLWVTLFLYLAMRHQYHRLGTVDLSAYKGVATKQLARDQSIAFVSSAHCHSLV